MKKLFPFYPLLFAIFPVIAVYSINLEMVPLGDTARPLAFALAGGTGLYAVLAGVWRSFRKGAALTCVTLFLFYSYGPLLKYADLWMVLGLDLVIFIGAIISLARSRGEMRSLTKALNFGSVVLVALPVIQIGMRKPPGASAAFLKVNLATAGKPAVAPAPDIFFIIVDGYGREDQLQRVMGYSNAPFVGELTKRGFYVAGDSRSNYCQTQLSLTATLNLSLLQDFPSVFAPDSQNRDALRNGMDHNFAESYLKSQGYTTVAVTSGFNEVFFDSADVIYDRPLSLTMLESTLVQLTPLATSDSTMESMLEDRRKSLRGSFENLNRLAQPWGRPKFTVAHILAPHPPFVFDRNGNAAHHRGPFGFWDGSHYMDFATPASYKEGYTEQVQYLNSELLKIVDNINAKATTKPIIIIEGDHGSKVGLDQESVAKTDVQECFGNLMAFSVPDGVKAKLYPGISSANTFRVLFDGLFGEKLPLIPDRSFYSPFSKPYVFTDVTAKVH